MAKKLKKETFTWIRDIYIQDFEGADKKKARPIFCFVSSKNYVLGYKIYFKLSKIKPNRIKLPFKITKNMASYIDLNKSFILDKRLPHKSIKKVKIEEIKFIKQKIRNLDYAKEEFEKSIENMEQKEKKIIKNLKKEQIIM